MLGILILGQNQVTTLKHKSLHLNVSK